MGQKMTADKSLPRVGVIILNYLKSADTIECLESVMKSDYENFTVMVVNNGGDKESSDKLTKWAFGVTAYDAVEGAMKKYSYPPSPKPLKLYKTAYDEDKGFSFISGEKGGVALIETAVNKGYAAGNNAGIKYGLENENLSYFWILNSDTVVEPYAMRQLVSHAEKLKEKNIKTAMTGSKLYYYGAEKVLNGVNGIYNKWSGTGRLRGAFEKDLGQYDKGGFRIDYISGASMLVSAEFIKDAGFMYEGYFLFYEEMDWAVRARAKGYGLAFCPQSIVWHKEGASTGSSSKGSKNSVISEFYGLRNRIRFTRKNFPILLPFVCAGFAGVILNRIIRGQSDRIPNVIKAFREGFKDE